MTEQAGVLTSMHLKTLIHMVYLNFTTACTIDGVPPSFTPNLITVTIVTATSLSRQIRNSLARAVVKAPKSYHITPVLRSLHWLKITASNTNSCHSGYLQSAHSHSLSVSARPHQCSTYSSTRCVQLLDILAPPCITPSLFHIRLKTHLFRRSFPPQTPFLPPSLRTGVTN